MSGESKQKRRYSCQSWNVAAKVVLIPDTPEDEEYEEECVTAFDHLHESDEETTEILQTCQEDISENIDKSFFLVFFTINSFICVLPLLIAASADNSSAINGVILSS